MIETSRFPELDSTDARMGELVFEFVQFLLDDDANLTPAGNLTGAARQLLRKRLDELMAAEEAGNAPGVPGVDAPGASLLDAENAPTIEAPEAP